MFQRIAARPLVLTVALSLSLAACDDGEDGSNSVTATDGDGTSTTGDDSTTAPGTTTTTPDPTTTGDTTGDAESTTGSAESSTGDAADSSSGAGDSSTSGGQQEVIEITGEYMDNYGSSHTIDDTTWSSDPGGKYPFGVNLEVVDNDADWTAGEDLYTKGSYSRYHWFEDGDGALWYCTQVFGAASLDDAINDPSMPDTADVATTGCGESGFPWTRLDPVE